jgi:hypothetical protein
MKRRIMKLRNTLTKLITMTVALAAIALIGSTWAAAQTESQNNLKQLHLGCIGFVDGQTLRFSAFNPNTPEEASEPVRAKVRLYDATGNVLAQSEEVDLAPGQFRTFDFNRAGLRASGEIGAGRLHVRAEIIYGFVATSQQPPDQFPAVMELIDSSTGRTILVGYQTGSVGWVKLSPD